MIKKLTNVNSKRKKKLFAYNKPIKSSDLETNPKNGGNPAIDKIETIIVKL